MAARQREDELSSRLAALEAEVGSLRGAKSGLQERVLELTERLQVGLACTWQCPIPPVAVPCNLFLMWSVFPLAVLLPMTL